MNTKKNLHRWKIEYFLTEVLSNPDVRELVNKKRLFDAILLVDDLYIYNTRQLNALIENIVY